MGGKHKPGKSNGHGAKTILKGSKGADSLTGTSGDDWIFGKRGDDVIAGEAGNDIILGGRGDDLLDGGADDDLLIGGRGADTVLGGTGEDILMGGRGNDVLQGGADDDILLGGRGDDTLTGGAGNDVVIGGRGGDLFVATADNGEDLYIDFSVLQGDRIDVSALGIDDFSGLTLISVNGGADTKIDLGGGHSITLAGVAVSDLGAGNFVFAAGVPNTPPGAVDAAIYANQGIAIPGSLAASDADGDALSFSIVSGPANGALVLNPDGTFVFTADPGFLGSDSFTYEVDDGHGGTATATVAIEVSDQSAAKSEIGTQGNNSFDGTAFADTFEGGDGFDFIRTGDGADVVDGGGGDDFIDLGENDGSGDRMIASAGSDTIDFSGNAQASSFYTLDYRSLTGSIAAAFLATAGTVTKSAGGADTVLGVDAIDGNSGGLQILGTAGDDAITASLANTSDFIDMSGSEGADSLTGGAGFERVSYHISGTVPAVSGIVATILGYGPFGGMSGTVTDTHGDLDQLADVDEIRGSDLDDIFNGGSGDDRFITRQGDDTVDGGGGFDLVRYDRSGVGPVTVDLGIGTATGTWSGNAFTDTLIDVEYIRGSRNGDDLITGSAANERFQGRGGNDTLLGEAGDDGLFGDNGNNSIEGGDGDDFISGGQGDDWLYGNDGFDLIEGGQGNDTIAGGTPGSQGFPDIALYENDPNAVHVDLLAGTANDGYGTVDALSGIHGVRGSSFADTLLGTDIVTGPTFGDWFTGNAGADHIDGRLGQDTIFHAFDPGAVTIDLGAGFAIDGWGATDTLVSIEDAHGSEFGDLIDGSSVKNQFWDNAGDDVVNGHGGNDNFFIGAGSDTIDGGTGTDEAFYLDLPPGAPTAGPGIAVTATGQGAFTVLDLSGGTDQLTDIENITGSDLDDTYDGNGHSGQFVAGAGNDVAIGGLGDDVLDGQDGDDRIEGGAGLDFLVGGADNDTFVFGTGSQADLIGDFSLVDLDVIELSSAETGFASGADALAAMVDDGLGNSVLLLNGGTDVLTIAGVVTADLAADDFSIV